jgi:vitamin B12 transporter
LGVSGEKASGISVSNASSTSTGRNPDEDSFSNKSIDAKLKAKLSSEHALTLSAIRSETDYQIDSFLPPGSPNPLGLNRITLDTLSKPILTNLNLKWDAQWSSVWKSTVLLGNSEEQSVTEYRRMSDGALNSFSKFNTKRTQAAWQNDFAIDKDVLSLMLENRSEAVDSTTLYKVKERQIQSALASYAFNRDSWNALAVLRNDDNSQFGSFNTWALSGGYRLTPSLRAVASMGASFQAPTLNQLYSPQIGSYVGNSTHKPQRSRSSEVGLKYNQGTLSLGAVVYHNDIQDYISPSTNIQNLQAVLRGATLNADLLQGNTSYSFSYDYADPRIFPGDARLARVAHNLLNARVTHRLADVSVFGEFRLSSNREDGRVVLPGYALLNLGVNWQLRKDLSLLARINNLSDTQYMLANGFSTPGRNVFASLSWSM